MDATPGVLISTLEDGYLTILATGLGANGRKWYVPSYSGNSDWMGSKFCFRGQRSSRSDRVGGCRMLLSK